MRRLTAWIGGVAGGIAAYRLLRRRGRPPAAAATEPAPTAAPPAPDDRAEELRAKLAENRVEPDPEPEPEPGPESPEDRRRQVHEEGRAALDEMKSDSVDG